MAAKRDWLSEARQDQIDARRWRKLISLCGHIEDGSDAVVKLYQDDATCTRFIEVGKKDYFVDGGSFEAIIDSIPDEELDRG